MNSGNREPISVIMPVFNNIKTVQKAITSTLRNLNTHDEFLILDDCSQVALSKSNVVPTDPRIRLMRNQENLGVAKALNSLIENASHNLIARMDADDIMLPQRLNHQEKLFRKNPELSANFCSSINFGKSIMNYWPSNLQPINGIRIVQKLLLGNPFSHPCALYRKQEISKVGAYRDSSAEDYDLWLRMALAGQNISKISYPGLLYRRHPSQITRKPMWLSKLSSDIYLRESHYQVAQIFGWTKGEVWRIMHQDKKSAEQLELLRDFKRFVDGISNKKM